MVFVPPIRRLRPLPKAAQQRRTTMSAVKRGAERFAGFVWFGGGWLVGYCGEMVGMVVVSGWFCSP